MPEKKKGQVAGMPWPLWIAYTIIYATGLAIASGAAMVYLPDVTYIAGVVPLDIQNFIWLFGIAVWGVCTARLFRRKSDD